VFHEKSTPLFLPATKNFIDSWLWGDPLTALNEELEQFLEQPTLPVDFDVTRIKSFKSGQAIAPPVYIAMNR